MGGEGDGGDGGGVSRYGGYGGGGVGGGGFNLFCFVSKLRPICGLPEIETE